MKVMVYKRFERFWHWSQAALIIGLMLTGFEIHSSYNWLGFERAVNMHIVMALLLIVLWLFAIFWHFTTGEWRQYIPTSEKLAAMTRYYAFGMFRDEAKPYKKSLSAKHNPLQRLAYLAFKLLISPLIWVSGMAAAGAGLAGTGPGGHCAHRSRLCHAGVLHCSRLSGLYRQAVLRVCACYDHRL